MDARIGDPALFGQPVDRLVRYAECGRGLFSRQEATGASDFLGFPRSCRRLGGGQKLQSVLEQLPQPENLELRVQVTRRGKPAEVLECRQQGRCPSRCLSQLGADSAVDLPPMGHEGVGFATQLFDLGLNR